ncbi:hypothetical protein B0H10DRAFT_2210909 [Mycena sp. CBHHK59/15]|nr:hypothetical protein B0H10DRAFT_2210909 [Mycena sp. CBHHK59/15]
MSVRAVLCRSPRSAAPGVRALVPLPSLRHFHPLPLPSITLPPPLLLPLPALPLALLRLARPILATRHPPRHAHRQVKRKPPPHQVVVDAPPTCGLASTPSACTPQRPDYGQQHDAQLPHGCVCAASASGYDGGRGHGCSSFRSSSRDVDTPPANDASTSASTSTSPSSPASNTVNPLHNIPHPGQQHDAHLLQRRRARRLWCSSSHGRSREPDDARPGDDDVTPSRTPRAPPPATSRPASHTAASPTQHPLRTRARAVVERGLAHCHLLRLVVVLVLVFVLGGKGGTATAPRMSHTRDTSPHSRSPRS